MTPRALYENQSEKQKALQRQVIDRFFPKKVQNSVSNPPSCQSSLSALRQLQNLLAQTRSRLTRKKSEKEAADLIRTKSEREAYDLLQKEIRKRKEEQQLLAKNLENKKKDLADLQLKIPALENWIQKEDNVWTQERRRRETDLDRMNREISRLATSRDNKIGLLNSQIQNIESRIQSKSQAFKIGMNSDQNEIRRLENDLAKCKQEVQQFSDEAGVQIYEINSHIQHAQVELRRREESFQKQKSAKEEELSGLQSDLSDLQSECEAAERTLQVKVKEVKKGEFMRSNSGNKTTSFDEQKHLEWTKKGVNSNYVGVAKDQIILKFDALRIDCTVCNSVLREEIGMVGSRGSTSVVFDFLQFFL